MSLATRKMPLPMIVPATMAIECQTFSSRTRSRLRVFSATCMRAEAGNHNAYSMMASLKAAFWQVFGRFLATFWVRGGQNQPRSHGDTELSRKGEKFVRKTRFDSLRNQTFLTAEDAEGAEEERIKKFF